MNSCISKNEFNYAEVTNPKFSWLNAINATCLILICGGLGASDPHSHVGMQINSGPSVCSGTI